MRKLIAVVALALLCTAVSLEAKGRNTAAEKGPLIDRLGGKESIEKVVDKFLEHVTKDKRINKFFAETVKSPEKTAALRNNLVDQICEAAGGPCEYKGKDMKEAHKGMGIGKKDFGALVADLTKALNDFKVAKADQKELLKLLAPMEGAIVEKGAKKGKKHHQG